MTAIDLPRTTERPILFTGAMVRAILASTKSQTRRLVKPQPPATTNEVTWNTAHAAFVPWCMWPGSLGSGHRTGEPIKSPYGVAGDRLWVRESFVARYFDNGAPGFRADYDKALVGDVVPEPKWTPSIHMPRRLSRLSLEVTNVRVERLQDIIEADILAEGITVPVACEMTGISWSDLPTLHHAWAAVWDLINGDRASWKSNPWVWRVSFKRSL